MLSTIEEIIADLKQGKMVIMVDHEDRENEGDLLMAAEAVTPEAINFMITHGRGLVCLPMEEERANELKLPVMVNSNTDPFYTAFTVSIDLKKGTTTGISPYDRAKTIFHAADERAQAEDFVRPGHVFPLRAKKGGVLKRAGHTEAAVDLARLAGFKPLGVICEIIKADGTMARLKDLEVFAQEFKLKIGSIQDLIAYRKKHEQLVEKIAEAALPSKYGQFKLNAYRDKLTGQDHLAIVKGNPRGEEPVLVRVHSECLTGDALGSLRCDCGDQLGKALQAIEREGKGVVVYLRQEGRGIGLGAKMKAYELQDQGLDTVEANEALGFPADLRDYSIGAQILTDLGIRNIRLMTNNPRKIRGLENYGLKIVERVPLQIPYGPENKKYLLTKRFKLQHDLEIGGDRICK
ncbi:bifunctional 3,4-dihydroxy-2-butanone-4-phosphate synthase/GTP cyclohydrolase II [Bacillota bacterium LX-D]|nr:bifunctional 3,4-dihydroxy-2-butanone-4-phosphate synthase/GTP cyclohydrolase II [Bacillota bacterium LX-D]